MRPTTSPGAIIQLGKRLSISAWTASESLLITALASKVFSFLMLLVEAQDLGWAPCSWSVYLLIMARSQSLASLSILPRSSQHLLLSPTTVFSPLTPSLSTLMLLYCLTMRPFMTSASAPLILRDPLTLTLVALFMTSPVTLECLSATESCS